MRKLLSYALMLGLAAFLMFPFVWMVLVSLHESKAAIPEFRDLIPQRFAFENYQRVLFMPELPVWRFFLNSLIVATVTVVGQTWISSMAAYGFSRLRFRWREQLFAIFVLSMMFGGAITQIPVFLLMRDLGWLDSYAALIVPGLSSAFSIFLLRQYFMQIPIELDEAARMDGASHWRIYAAVILPLSKTALATCATFTFVAVWTDFFWPLLATSSVQMRTLEVGLSVFKNSYGATNWPMQMTAAVIVLIPVIVVFLTGQRFFVRGLASAGLK